MVSRFARVSGLLLVTLSVVLPQAAHAFGPCTRSFPDNVSYIPELNECGGKAAIILSGNLQNAFSVVVRACDNGDRDPCYKNLDSCGTNASSPFKVQQTIQATINREGKVSPATIHCLKEKGNSSVYRMVRRLTIKRVNPVRNTNTDVLKVCLSSRIRAFNPVTIVNTGAVSGVGNTGYNAACRTQKYLGCDLNAALQRTCPMN